jgi:hypothetical protein
MAIRIACGSMPLSPRAVWTFCACGVSITHDGAMEDRVRAKHPGAALVFECMSCAAPRIFDPEAVKEMLAETREALSPELREFVEGVDEDQLIERLREIIREGA